MSANRGRFACVDALESMAEQLGALVRWEVRGPDMTLCVGFEGGTLEATPRGDRCEVRVRDLDLTAFARLASLVRDMAVSGDAPASTPTAPRASAAGRLVAV